MEEFRKWLIGNKKFGSKSCNGHYIKIKEGQTILENTKINSKSADEVKESGEFEKLSVSVKSQIRRAIKL